jgi:uncharacterized protein YkwD
LGHYRPSFYSAAVSGIAVATLVACAITAGAAALLLMFSPGTALAVKASPPTVTCAGNCETCLEREQGGRCVKCGIDPACLGGDPGLSPDFSEMLKAHNHYRAEHGTPALSWSPQLAKGAQDWANACTPDPKNKDRFAHSKEAWSSPSGYGENLFWGVRTTANNAVDWWYAENKRYDYNNAYASLKAGDTDSTKEVRHFTQVVWRDSKQLGCAVGVCRGLNFWVCRYSPPGNFNAQNPGVLANNVPPPGGVPQTQSSGTKTQSTGTKPQSTTHAGDQPARGEWSAFATDKSGNWGYGAHWATEQVAQKLAMDGCGGAGIGCKVFWITKDRCVSYTESRVGGFWYAAGGGSSQQQAVQNAIRFCQSGTAPPNSCKSIVAECR